MAIVLGIDSSTQGIKGTVIDTVAGTILKEVEVNFGKEFPQYEMPSGFIEAPGGKVYSDPMMWLDGLDMLFARMQEAGVPLDKIEAISGDGQQHGSVYLNGRFDTVLTNFLDVDQSLSGQFSGAVSRNFAPIWKDESTADQCAQITSAMGGARVVSERSGSIATMRFTGPQIRRFAQEDISGWSQTRKIHLVSSFMGSVMAGRSISIDPGDGAGMNLMNLGTNDWDPDLLQATAPGLRERLPNIEPSQTVVGLVNPYFVQKYGLNPECKAVLWTGDNPASLVGMGAASENRTIISLGTSATVFASMDKPDIDPRGYGHVFGNPLGGSMSLICFKNSTPTIAQAREVLGIPDWNAFSQSLADTPPGNGQRVVLPFFDPEITPRVTKKGLVAVGWNPSPAEMTRGVIEGLFIHLHQHSKWVADQAKEIWLTAGGSKDDGIAQIAADVFGKTVRRMENPGSASLGSAMRAAVAIGVPIAQLEKSFASPDPGRDVQPNPANRATYAALEDVYMKALHSTYPEAAAPRL